MRIVAWHTWASLVSTLIALTPNRANRFVNPPLGAANVVPKAMPFDVCWVPKVVAALQSAGSSGLFACCHPQVMPIRLLLGDVRPVVPFISIVPRISPMSEAGIAPENGMNTELPLPVHHTRL